MYEMEGPRLVSRHRPADCSAPLRRSTAYRARNLTSAPVAQITGGSGVPRAGVARGFPLAGGGGFPPVPVAQGLPSPGGSELSSRYATRGFPSAAQFEVFPFADGPELSSPHLARGFPSATSFEVFPAPVAQSFLLVSRLGVSPPPHTLKFSLRRWPEVPPCGFPSCRVAPGFSRDQRPQSLPNTGWPGVSPEPVVRSLLLTGGAGLLLARKPGVVLCRVARGFPFAGYRPWW